ncbi:MAG: thermonuclease family protein [Kiritimatiellae bacterium]|nr:thermonuclease family protein [Kiritimatiellia bacterium]
MKLEPGNWQLGEPVTPVLGANTQHPATVRLAGIDAPELTQPFGPEAKTVLTASTLGRIVRLEYEGTDRYGRILGDVFTGDIWVNLQLVRDGLAWRYPRCKATRIRRAEQNARRAGLGLWADPQPLAPWLFRKGRNGRKKAQKAQKPREGMLEELGRAA